MSSGKCKTDDCIILIEYIWFKAFDSSGFGKTVWVQKHWFVDNVEWFGNVKAMFMIK